MPHEWDSPEYVRQWVADGDKSDPERAEQITALVGLIRRSTEESIEVLDLGAGYGIVTREVLTAYPNAQVVCLDGSAEMLKHGEARLVDWGDQLSFVVSNFESPDWLATLPTDRQYDAVVSSRAIHHVVDDRKQALYAEIFQLLKPGGCFANHDLVRKPDDPIRDNNHDPFGTVEDQVDWLKNVGFVDVECFWQTEGRALFGGYKPSLT